MPFLIFPPHDLVNVCPAPARKHINPPCGRSLSSPASRRCGRNGTIQECYGFVGIPQGHTKAVRQRREESVFQIGTVFPALFLRIGIHGYRSRPPFTAEGGQRHGSPVSTEFPIGRTERRFRMRFRQQRKFPDAHLLRMVVTVDIAGDYMIIILLPGQGNLHLHPGIIGSLKYHAERRFLFSLLLKKRLIPELRCPEITACLRVAFLRYGNPDFIFTVIDFYI